MCWQAIRNMWLAIPYRALRVAQGKVGARRQRTAKGMTSFADVITPADSQAVRAYVLSEAARQHSPVTRALQWAAPHFCMPVSWMLD